MVAPGGWGGSGGMCKRGEKHSWPRYTPSHREMGQWQNKGCLSLWLSHMHRYTLDTDLQGCPSIHHPGTFTFYLQRIRDQSPDKAADASDEHLAGTENNWRALFQPRRICPSSVSRLLGRRCTHLVSNHVFLLKESGFLVAPGHWWSKWIFEVVQHDRLYQVGRIGGLDCNEVSTSFSYRDMVLASQLILSVATILKCMTFTCWVLTRQRLHGRSLELSWQDVQTMSERFGIPLTTSATV